MSYITNPSNTSLFDVLLTAPWLQVAEIMRVAREMSRLNVAYAVDLRSAWQLWSNLNYETPFERTSRFTNRGSYLCMITADWTNKESTLRGAMMSIAILLNVEFGRNAPQQGPGGNGQRQPELDAQGKQALANALQSYSQMLRNIQNQLYNREGVYNQIRFESEYNFHWDPHAVPPPDALVSWQRLAAMLSLDPAQMLVGNNEARATSAAWPALANTVALNNAVFDVPVGVFYIWGTSVVATYRVRYQIARAGQEMSVMGLTPAVGNN